MSFNIAHRQLHSCRFCVGFLHVTRYCQSVTSTIVETTLVELGVILPLRVIDL
jgi:hypothetical protein